MPQVKIRIERGQEQAGAGNINQQTSVDEKKNVATTSFFASKMLGLGKQIVNYSASNVAAYTGNYILQDRINEILEVTSDATTIALGFAVNPVAGAFAIAGVTTKKILQNTSERRNDFIQERERNILLERSGNATTNGSRGTEN